MAKRALITGVTGQDGAYLSKILLEKDDLKRFSFVEKQTFYVTTSFCLAEKVSEYTEWNLQSVNDYQAWMAKKAVTIWKVD